MCTTHKTVKSYLTGQIAIKHGIRSYPYSLGEDINSV